MKKRTQPVTKATRTASALAALLLVAVTTASAPGADRLVLGEHFTKPG